MPLNSTRGAGSAKGFGFTTGGVKPADFDYLVVAGGAGGAIGLGGGGGAGGMRSSFPGGTKVTISKKITTISVASGGAAAPMAAFTGPTVATARGGDSSIGTDIVSAGGGTFQYADFDPTTPGTSPVNQAIRNGGSGSGVTHQQNGPVGIGNTPPVSPSQGFPGGPGGGSFGASGGGGAGGAGVNGATPGHPSNAAGPGGPGANNSISDTSVTYSGGGGGGGYNSQGGSGGPGGGGAGGAENVGGTPGGPNTGGAGGSPGAGGNPGTGTSGGSGIVYLRIPSANAPVSLAVAPGTNTLTTLSPSGDKLATFTVSGTLTI
jgi:hypothetical protein